MVDGHGWSVPEEVWTKELVSQSPPCLECVVDDSTSWSVPEENWISLRNIHSDAATNEYQLKQGPPAMEYFVGSANRVPKRPSGKKTRVMISHLSLRHCLLLYATSQPGAPNWKKKRNEELTQIPRTMLFLKKSKLGLSVGVSTVFPCSTHGPLLQARATNVD